MNEKELFIILNNYINKHFDKSINLKNLLSDIYSFTNFIETNNYEITQDIIIELIKNNNTFNSYLTLIFNRYNSKIVNGELDNIFKDELLISFIETYCSINNIEIYEKYDLEVDGYYRYDDDVKIYLQEISKIPLLSRDEEIGLLDFIGIGFENIKKSIFIAIRIFIKLGLPVLIIIYILFAIFYLGFFGNVASGDDYGAFALILFI